MSASEFASFAAYTPPLPRYQRQYTQDYLSSYQAGAVPISNSSRSNRLATMTAVNPYETRYGTNIDILSASAYLLGPLSAFLILVFETVNDFSRFHAYQSALLTTPMLLLRIAAAIFEASEWLQRALTWTIIAVQAYMACRTYLDANELYYRPLPLVGAIAAQYVAEE